MSSPADEYKCPKCKEYPPEDDGGSYVSINGKDYPIYTNAHEYYTDYGMGKGWTEIHYCVECAIEFEFDNGNL